MKTLLGLLAIVPSTLLRGYVITLLWAWFVMPTFGLPILTIGYAIGLSGLVSFLTLQVKKNDKAFDMLEAVLVSVFVTLIYWSSGAIVHFFIQHPIMFG